MRAKPDMTANNHQRSRTCRRLVRGLSLVEILVSLVILGILFAILSSVLGSSKQSALLAHSTSNLRQILQANAMYREVEGGLPAHASQLHHPSSLPCEVIQSPLDPHKEGTWNRLGTVHGKTSGCRASYLTQDSLLDPGHLVEQRAIEEPDVAWIADISLAIKQWPSGMTLPLLADHRTILRGHLDTHVSRAKLDTVCPKDSSKGEGLPIRSYSYGWIFANPTSSERAETCGQEIS